jgi:hypothetical protein
MKCQIKYEPLHITWAAFPHLETCLTNPQAQHTTKKDQVENYFLANEVLEKQGWKKAKYFDKTACSDINLTTDYIKQRLLEANQNQQNQGLVI